MPYRTDDLLLSFLPLSHTFERTAGYYVPMMRGATVAYARSVHQLQEDLLTIRPTILVSVPRIYERIYGGIRAKLAEGPALSRKLFNLAVEMATAASNSRADAQAGLAPAMAGAGNAGGKEGDEQTRRPASWGNEWWSSLVERNFARIYWPGVAYSARLWHD